MTSSTSIPASTTHALLDCVEVQTGNTPIGSIIWMHGLGADGYDFVPIVNELGLRDGPALRFIFPHANTMPVTINGGYVMRAWYDIRTPDLSQGADTREDEQGLRASQAQIEQLITREKQRGIAPNKIVLAGFSQGGAMTLQTGLRQSETLAGLIVLSAYLPLHTKIAAEKHPANQNTPIFMAHGTHDPIVPYARGKASAELLQQLGYHVAWHEYPMQHSVCGEEIAAIGQWLQRVFD